MIDLTEKFKEFVAREEENDERISAPPPEPSPCRYEELLIASERLSTNIKSLENEEGMAGVRACKDAVEAFSLAAEALGDDKKGPAGHFKCVAAALFTSVQKMAAERKAERERELKKDLAIARAYHALPEQKERLRSLPKFSRENVSEISGYEDENRELCVRMVQRDTSELQKITKQIAEISEMQTAIAIKVAEQAEMIAGIQESAAESLQNIRDANDALRRATTTTNHSFCARMCGHVCCFCCGQVGRDCCTSFITFATRSIKTFGAAYLFVLGTVLLVKHLV